MEQSTTDSIGVLDDPGRELSTGQRSPFLFLILECDRPLAHSSRIALAELDSVTIGRGFTRSVRRAVESDTRSITVNVPDRCISTAHARLIRVQGRWMLEDAGSKNGTTVNGFRVDRCVLTDGDLFQVGRTFFTYRELVATPAAQSLLDVYAPRPVPSTRRMPALFTLSPELGLTFNALEKLSDSQIPVLIQGATGTGKEVVAKAIHAASMRSGELIAVNCGALPDNLVESQLFGHKKGSFSGATEDQLGLVRSSDGGTLFLDEIGDLSLTSQAALLRVLQEQEVLPIGAAKPIKVDFRLLSATHRDLLQCVNEGTFRSDLYARIAGFVVKLPPLAARREDIGVIMASLFLRWPSVVAERVTLESDAALALLSYDWPLNVRELEQCLRSALALAGGDGRITLAHLTEQIRASRVRLLSLWGPGSELERQDATTDRELVPVASELDRPKRTRRHRSPEDEEQRKAQLQALLVEHEGNISAIARVMGKRRMQIQRWIKRYGLEPESFRK